MPAECPTPACVPLVLNLDQAADQPQLTGNKAANLARLMGAPGPRIPPGFVITAAAQPQGMTAMLREEIAGHYHRVSAVGSGCANALVSVRSSAICEDLSNAAFAGQYLTLTNVCGENALLTAIQRVWDSNHAPRVSAYRAAQGLDESISPIGVLVQLMVPDVRAAGTLFTLDPETGLPFFEVSASWGLGETLVGGHVTPDVWLLDPFSGVTIKRRLGAKRLKIAYARTLRTNVMIPTTRDERHTFCMQPAALGQLFTQAHAVWTGSGYGPAQHVELEFALDNQGQIWILQVRPETAWRRADAGLMAVALDRVPPSARVLEGGLTAWPGVATGRLCVVRSVGEAEARLRPGDILCCEETTNSWERFFPKVTGVVAATGGPGGHTAVVARELGKPSLVGVGALDSLPDGQVATLDATQRVVLLGAFAAEPLARLLTPERGAVLLPAAEQEWRQASVLSRTRIDGSGKRWIGKPGYPVSPYMQDVYLRVHQQIGRRLNSPAQAEIAGGLHWLCWDDVTRWSAVLGQKSLAELEALDRERLAATAQFNAACVALTPSAAGLSAWLAAYEGLNSWIGLGFSLYRATEALLSQLLAPYRFPGIYESQARKSAEAALGPSQTAQAQCVYDDLRRSALQDERVMPAVRDALERGQMAVLRSLPEFYAQLCRYAFSFKVTPAAEPDLAPETALRAVLRALLADASEALPSGGSLSVRSAVVEEFFPDNAELGRALRLAVSSERQRQDAHHIRAWSHWVLRDRLAPLVHWLTSENVITCYEDIFQHAPSWLLAQAEAYEHRMASLADSGGKR